MPCTAPDVRAIMPTQTEIQQKQSAKAIDSATAAAGRDAGSSRSGSR